MNRHFLWLLALLSLLLGSCGGDSTTPTEPTAPPAPDFTLQPDAVIGSWQAVQLKLEESGEYAAWPYEETFATFCEDGTYRGEGHFGSGKGTYIIIENSLITSIEGSPYITYQVTSLENEVAEMRITLHDYNQHLWLRCQRVEWLDEEPKEEITEESIFNNEEQIRALTALGYQHLSDALHRKCAIEAQLLAGDFSTLRADSQEVAKLWESCYQLLNLTNYTLNGLHNCPLEEYTIQRWASHLLALRGCCGYLLASLWGDVPYHEEAQADSTLKPLQATKILQAANDNLCAIDLSLLEPKAEYLNEAAIKLILAEIALTRKEPTQALEHLLAIETTPFVGDTLFLCYNPTEESTLICYTKPHIELLKQEAEGNTETLQAAWGELFFGQWPMLVRTGAAELLPGYQPHYNRLPIPESELLRNPNLGQNRGY